MTVVQSVRHPAPLALCILSSLSFPCQLVCHAVSASVISQSSVLSFSSFWLCNISCFLLGPHLATSTSIHVVPQLQSSLVFSQLASFSFECDYPKAVGKLRFALIDGHRRRVTPRLAGCMSLSRLAPSLPSLSLHSPAVCNVLVQQLQAAASCCCCCWCWLLVRCFVDFGTSLVKKFTHATRLPQSHTHTYKYTYSGTTCFLCAAGCSCCALGPSRAVVLIPCGGNFKTSRLLCHKTQDIYIIYTYTHTYIN